MGYPVISEDELGVTVENIKNLFILPVLKNIYFNYFPIRTKVTYGITTTFEYDFPDVNTYGVYDARINTKPYTGGAVKVLHPLINEINIKQSTAHSQRMWGTDNDYGYGEVRIADKLRTDARMEDIKSFSFKVNYEERKIEGYTNVYGRMTVVWAKFSENWSDIKYQREEDTIKLAQSYILRYFGNLWNMDNAKLPSTIDPSEILSRSDDLYEEVITKWNAFTKPTIVRN